MTVSELGPGDEMVVTDQELAIARVEPLTRTRMVRGPFDYKLGADLAGVQVGALVSIPFAGRKTLGVVVGLARESEIEPDRLAEPEAVVGWAVPDDLVDLAMWIAADYCSTPSRALSLMLAPGAAQGVKPKEILIAELTDAGAAALENGQRLTAGQRAALARLQLGGPTTARQIGTPLLRRLERRGLVTLGPRVARRRPVQTVVGARSRQAPSLTPSQQAAADEIASAIANREHASFLLHGVTGSGKTEVYLQAVERTLAAGRDAIVLVPEIGLTPQARGRFEARLGPLVAVLHSALGEGERHDEWQRLRAGEARVCLGPRSAVFAPLPDVGLIVVDEEHDSSYKHEGDPRYDARTVAAHRAERQGAVLVCGSATPRPESVAALRRLRLPERIDGRPLPPVEVLDMRGAHQPLHPRTRMALADVRRDRGKAIVLLNRRGWSNFLSCRACGTVAMCPHCEVSLVLHRAAGFVACHHCGHRRDAPSRCPSCGSAAMARHGTGTERLEHELRAALGDDAFPILRLDADVAAGKDRAALTLASFEAASSGVLVGTQMVAKGHDFPDVTLGVVLDADQTLRFPDFRSEERTFALVTQLAGRAGRGDAGGRVLVQTLAPEARSILHASRHDTDGFLPGELARRRALGYPPFGTLIRIVCSAPDAEDAATIAACLREVLDLPGAVLGPAPLFRLRGRSRRQILIKTTERREAIEAVAAAVNASAAMASKRKVSIAVDVDPQ